MNPTALPAMTRRFPVRASPPILAMMLALAGPGGPVDLAAQGSSDTGSPIRIHSAGADTIVEGRLVSLNSTELIYETPAGQHLTMDRRSVRLLEILRNRGREQIGFAVGAMTGAMAWGVFSLATLDPSGVGQDHHASVAFTPITGGLVGGVAGWFLGRSIRTRNWESVVIMETPGRPGGGLSVGFRVGLGSVGSAPETGGPPTGR